MRDGRRAGSRESRVKSRQSIVESPLSLRGTKFRGSLLHSHCRARTKAPIGQHSTPSTQSS